MMLAMEGTKSLELTTMGWGGGGKQSGRPKSAPSILLFALVYDLAQISESNLLYTYFYAGWDVSLACHLPI